MAKSNLNTRTLSRKSPRYHSVRQVVLAVLCRLDRGMNSADAITESMLPEYKHLMVVGRAQ
jgi:hypothetical protein